jgi:cytochrome bd-type quinol oxidase subunit 2
MLQQVIAGFARRPQTLFRLDAAGALLSAGGHLVLLQLHQHIGMPKLVLWVFVAIAMVYCLYSLACSRLVQRHWAPFVLAIGIANLLYGVLSLGAVAQYYPVMMPLGIAYFVLEAGVLAGIVLLELTVWRALRSNKSLD